MKWTTVCRTIALLLSTLALALSAAGQQQQQRGRQPRPGPAPQDRPPNILVIMGDDIGMWNLSCYHNGMLGYSTPNIDRIAREGARFTDYYAQQSCTAGRAAFITGQMPVRTGLTKVGFPGADIGLRPEDPTIATLLKPLGYQTAQFGKNHLGDRDEFLPTAHGFDEFFGNLYHLNAEEEPENPDYPQNPAFRRQFGPRGVIRSYANPDGSQSIEDTGPLTRQRMETIDDEFVRATEQYLERAARDGRPFFIWFNSTRMHMFTHVRPELQGRTGLGEYADGMVEHDADVGRLLDKLDELGLAENTIVVYTTDNGPMLATWPDAGTTPFRGEKNTGWEGGFRVPCLVRWPGHIPPGAVINDIMASEDWLPTFVAAAGLPDVKERLLRGQDVGGRHYRVHLDGYDQNDLLHGYGPSKRREFFYFSDDGDLLAMRFDRLKAHFIVQRAEGFDVWREPFVHLRVPLLFDLRVDPFERGDVGMNYDDWMIRRAFLLVPLQTVAGRLFESFQEFPPRQRPASFTVDEAIEKLTPVGPGE